jgi:hypothetical protein
MTLLEQLAEAINNASLTCGTYEGEIQGDNFKQIDLAKALLAELNLFFQNKFIAFATKGLNLQDACYCHALDDIFKLESNNVLRMKGK